MSLQGNPLTRKGKGNSPARVNRKSVAEINLSNLITNYDTIRDVARNTNVIAVVKADAYGHGAVKVASELAEKGIYALGVAFASEAIELRESGINIPIVVFFDNENIEDYFKYDLIPVIFDETHIEGFVAGAKKYGRPIDAHIKIDTGMGRVGLSPDTCLKKIIDINRLKEINVLGIMSHFSEADLKDGTFADAQLSLFVEIRDKLKNSGMNCIAHIANSAAVMAFESSHLNAVRPGLMLYGYSPFERKDALLPVMTVKTHLISVRRVPAGTPISYGRTFVTKRPSLIGVIPVGYADGYSRLFSNNGYVITNGKKAPVVGRVCMDLSMIDLTDIGIVNEGDEVTILSDDIKSGLTAKDLSDRIGTIPYEILTSLGNSARREYKG